MDEIEPLIFTAAVAALVSVAARPQIISHLLIWRLRGMRAPVCWYILIDIWWWRLIWQQPSGESWVGGVGGRGEVLTSILPSLIRLIFIQANTSIRLGQLCGSRHTNTVITLITLNSKFWAQTVSQLSRGGDMMWLYWGLSPLWVWVEVSLKTEATELETYNYLALFKMCLIILGQNLIAWKCRSKT